MNFFGMKCMYCYTLVNDSFNFSMLLKLIYNKASETVVIDMPQIWFFFERRTFIL